MGLRVRTNVQSLVAQRHLAQNQEKASKHMNQLSSGYRITKAADDAAGLAISENMRSDIRSMAQAQRNTADAISLLQVAEGGLEEITNIMIRLKELSVQAASDTIGIRERDYLNREFMALKYEIDRIAISTDFNGTRLLVGDRELDENLMATHNPSPLEFQIGKDYFLPSDSLEAPNPVNIIRADFRQFNATISGDGSLELGDPDDEDGTRIDTKIGAQSSLMKLDAALGQVASYRASIGAIQNRLDSTDRNLSIGIENISTARSRIKDANFASETSEYTQANILTQAGAAILSQANQIPSIALQLLQNI